MMLAAWYHPILAVAFAFIAILLILIILLQRGRGSGLAGAFGGAGAAATSAFGAKTGDALTWITVGMAVLFLLFAIVLNYVFREADPGLEAVAQPQQQQTAPGAPQNGAEAAAPVAPADAAPGEAAAPGAVGAAERDGAAEADGATAETPGADAAAPGDGPTEAEPAADGQADEAAEAPESSWRIAPAIFGELS
jgi:preprotein translocase subunit SecG